MKSHLAFVMIATTAIFFLAPDLGAQDTVRSREGVTQQSQQTRQSKQERRSRKNQQSQENQNQQFVDLDGDGYNDNAPDHDGDGIPNRFDPDWKRRNKTGQARFIDMNGDGINDNLQEDQSNGRQQMEPAAGEEDGSSLKNQEQKQLRKGRKGSGKSGS